MSRRRPVVAVVLGLSTALVASLLPAAVSAAPASGLASGPAAALAVADPAPGGLVPSPDPNEVGGASDGTLIGTPSEPRRDVEEVKTLQQQARPVDTSGAVDKLRRLAEQNPGITQSPAYQIVSGYQKSTSVLQTVPVGKRSYEDRPITHRNGFGTRDASGVRMFSWPGEDTLYNHPVGQSQYVILNLNSYRLTGEQVYLDMARVNAQRLIDTRVESAGGWYYPYDFDFAVHGDTTQTLIAPWYSAMGQGQALSAFTRMYETTGEPKWKEAADRTFISLLQAPNGDAPFSSRVDAQGRLWLEEYPRYPVENSEMVLNGHIFALFGLHDYWQMSGRTQLVADIILGGLKTVELTALNGFRRPSWASVYSLWHAYPSFTYHHIHTDQFTDLWTMTKNPFWVTTSTTYRSDWAVRGAAGVVVLTPRVKTMYKLDSEHRITATRQVSLSSQTAASFDQRWRIQGGPMALRIINGPYAGWWVEEKFGTAWARGATDLHLYEPQVKLTFGGNKLYSAYRLDSVGNVVGSKTLFITRNSNAPTGRSAIVQGRPAYYMHVGAFAGYWVPVQSTVYVGAY